MKKIASIRNTAFTLAVAVILQTVSVAQSQPRPKGDDSLRPPQPLGEGRMSERRPQGGQPGFQPGGQPGFTMERVLTEDQRESIRKTLEANRDKTRANMEKIREARKELNKLALEAEFNEDVVRAKAMEIAKLEVEMTVMRLKALSEVQPALSQEQIDKVINPPQMQAPLGGRPEGQNTGSGNRRMGQPQTMTDGEPDRPAPPRRERP